MKVLITGAAGFIGSHLYEKLVSDGHKVIGIDNLFHPSLSPVKDKVKYADVRYMAQIEPFVKQVDVVYHLAAQIHVDRSILSPQETVDININGTLNVLEAVRKHNKMMVFASSSEVYGSQQKTMNEDHPLDCQSPYAASKVAGERLCKAYYETYKTKVAILRNFNTFGPYQADDSYGGVIAIFTRKALKGLPLEIYGSGQQERDYMYVQDALFGYELCVSKELWGQTINIGTGKVISINELAKTIKEITKSKSKIVHVEARAGEVMRLCANITKAKGLGYKSTTNLKQNLRIYVEWYKNTLL